MPTDDHIVIDVRELTRTFGKFTAVDRVSFDVKKGEIFGFLGANGAGKTTTIRMLCGLLAPTGGAGRVLDFDIKTESERIKPKVGYMSQKFSLYPDLTVIENLDFFGGIQNLCRAKLKERKEWAVEMAGLSGKETVLTSTLSGGWKQRLALGAALLHEPELLFLDEPTAGVSPQARRDFWDLIHEISETGTTVFVTSHYMDEVEHCHRLVLMSRGRIVALDTPQELKAKSIGGNLVHLDCGEPPDLVRKAFARAPDVLDIQPFGAGYHVLVPKEADGPDVVRRAADASNLKVGRIAPVEPNLEDVFISVIGSVER